MSDLPGWLFALYRARADIETACEKIGQLDADNDRLRAEVKRLKAALAQCRDMAVEGIYVPACAERWLERIEEVADAGRAMPDIGDLDRPHPAVVRATAAEADAAAAQERYARARRMFRGNVRRRLSAEANAAAAREQVRKLREALRQIAERDEGSDPRFTDRMIARAALQGEG